MARRVEKRTRV